MKPGTGNQHASMKGYLLALLEQARVQLVDGYAQGAQTWIECWRSCYRHVPASTKRRWRCGR